MLDKAFGKWWLGRVQPFRDVPAEKLAAEREPNLRRRAFYRDVALVFAPSGTDLEYVALACVRTKRPGGINAILLGADEVGSGCIQSAHGLYFATETALAGRRARVRPRPLRIRPRPHAV